MSENMPTLPDSLRSAVAADIRPVKPLAAPWLRVLWAVPIAVALLLTVFLYFGLRSDFEAMSVLLSWVPLVLEVAFGLAILTIALHEAIPGRRLPREVVYGVCLTALALHLAVNIAIWLRDPMGWEDSFAISWMCLRYEFLLGVPFLVVVTWMAARALPMRPSVIGALAGVGSGFIADASWRMHCPVSVPSHFITSHLGGIVVLGLAGWLVGVWLERRRDAQFS